MKNIVKSTEPSEERGLNEVIRLIEPEDQDAPVGRRAPPRTWENPASSSSPAAASSPTRWQRCGRGCPIYAFTDG